jgi:hypothetical protein
MSTGPASGANEPPGATEPLLSGRPYSRRIWRARYVAPWAAAGLIVLGVAGAFVMLHQPVRHPRAPTAFCGLVTCAALRSEASASRLPQPIRLPRSSPSPSPRASTPTPVTTGPAPALAPSPSPAPTPRPRTHPRPRPRPAPTPTSEPAPTPTQTWTPSPDPTQSWTWPPWPPPDHWPPPDQWPPPEPHDSPSPWR